MSHNYRKKPKPPDPPLYGHEWIDKKHEAYFVNKCVRCSVEIIFDPIAKEWFPNIKALQKFSTYTIISCNEAKMQEALS